MSFTRKCLPCLPAVAALAATLPASGQSTLTWDWTLTGHDNGSGTITTEAALSDPTDTGYFGYFITDMTGTYDAETITGAWPVSTAYGIFGADQVLTTNATIDDNGIAFFLNGATIASGDTGIFATAYETNGIINTQLYTYNAIDSGFAQDSFGLSTLTVTEVTPEPTTLALGVLGLAGLSAARRRR